MKTFSGTADRLFFTLHTPEPTSAGLGDAVAQVGIKIQNSSYDSGLLSDYRVHAPLAVSSLGTPGAPVLRLQQDNEPDFVLNGANANDSYALTSHCYKDLTTTGMRLGWCASFRTISWSPPKMASATEAIPRHNPFYSGVLTIRQVCHLV